MNDAPSFDSIEEMKGQIDRPVFVRSYTPDDDAQLRELAGQGLLAIDIGLALGRTKDSVTGRCTRLKIPLSRKGDQSRVLRVLAASTYILPPKPPKLPKAKTLTSPSWFTAEDDARLVELVGKGRSMREIADIIGRTRNSVIGRSHRLGMSIKRSASKHRHDALQHPRPSKAHYGHIALQTVGLRVPERVSQSRGIAVPKIKAARKPTEPNVDCPPEPTMLQVQIVSLEPGICHWPLGDPKHSEFSYCGAKAVVDKPYCTHHEWKAHNETHST